MFAIDSYTIASYNKTMKKEVEDLIRSLSLPQLEVLKMLTQDEKGVFSNKEMSTTLSTASTQLGALITPLRRHKIENEPLVVPAGKHPTEGNRWQLNTKIIDRDALKLLLVEMEI